MMIVLIKHGTIRVQLKVGAMSKENIGGYNSTKNREGDGHYRA